MSKDYFMVSFTEFFIILNFVKYFVISSIITDLNKMNFILFFLKNVVVVLNLFIYFNNLIRIV